MPVQNLWKKYRTATCTTCFGQVTASKSHEKWIHVSRKYTPTSYTSSDIVVFDKDTTKLELLIERDKKECINQRHYKNYTEEMIEKDFKEFEFVLIELVDYDLEQNGASFSEKVSENGITREWIKRESILKKIPTLCHIT